MVFFANHYVISVQNHIYNIQCSLFFFIIKATGFSLKEGSGTNVCCVKKNVRTVLYCTAVYKGQVTTQWPYICVCVDLLINGLVS